MFPLGTPGGKPPPDEKMHPPRVRERAELLFDGIPHVLGCAGGQDVARRDVAE